MDKMVILTGQDGQDGQDKITTNKMENKIQGDFHMNLRNKYPRTVSICWHIPNGGKRTIIEAVQLKAMGVTEGVPDYQISIPCSGYAGMFIEFKDVGCKTSDKIAKGLKLTPHEERQQKVQNRLKEAGYLVIESDSWRYAMAAFEMYAQGTKWLEINPAYVEPKN